MSPYDDNWPGLLELMIVEAQINSAESVVDRMESKEGQELIRVASERALRYTYGRNVE